MNIVIIATAVFTFHSLVLYQGCYLTELIKPDVFEPPVATVDDLVELIRQKKLVLNLEHPDFVLAVQLRQPASPAMLKLNQSLAENPPFYREGEYGIIDGQAVVSIVNAFYMHEYTMSATECRVIFVEAPLPVKHLGIMASRHMRDDLFEEFSNIILDRQEQFRLE